MLVMLLGVGGNLWADSYSMTPNQTSTGSNATNYITTLTEFTYNSISWKMNQWNPKTLQVKTNQGKAADEFRFYNTTAFPQRITQVVITFSALTVSDASKLMFLGGTSEVTATTGGSAGTWDSNSKTLTWTPSESDNFTYFAFYQNGKAVSGSNYLVESDAIVVKYGSSTSDVAKPTFSPAAGKVLIGTEITISADEGTTIYYTKDGTTPTVNSTRYKAPFAIEEDVIIKAIAVDEDGNTSVVSTSSYTMELTLAYKNTNSNYYKKVTSVEELENGDAILIVGEAKGVAMSTIQNTNNRGEVAVSISNGIIDNPAETAQKLVLAKLGESFYFYDGAYNNGESLGGFLYAASSKDNYLRTGIKIDNNAKASIVINNGDATILFQGNNTRNLIRHNNTSSLFSCYASNSTTGYAVQIYKEVERPDVTQRDAEFAFSPTEILITNGEPFTTPTLTMAENYDGTIVYTSSKPSVATVNSNTGAIEIKGIGTTTITASAEATDNFYADEASYTLTVKRADDDKGGKNNPYTVADAIAAINEGIDVTGVYVKGIISQVDSYDSTHGSITYWISDDGTTDSQLECYSGKGLNGAQFSSVDELSTGYEVVVYGTLQKYNDIYEFNYNNEIVSIVRPTHSVIWSVNGTLSDPVSFEEGTPLIYDTPAIEGKTFIGWTTEPINGVVDEAPALASLVMGTEDITLYAVFASQEGSGDPTWTETALSALTASDIFVIVGNGYAMPHDNGTNDAPSAAEVTVSGSNLTSTVTDNIKWNVSGNATEGYTFYPNGDDKKWLYCNTTAASSSNNNMRVGTGDRKVFELDTNGYLVTKDTYTTRYLSLYNSQDFRGYVSTSNGAFVPAFYKYCSNISYSDYCTTIKSAIELSAPIVFHDSGTYREPLKVTIVGQGIIKYTLNDGAEQTYEGPIDINGETTLVAWVEQEDGVKSDPVTREYKFAEAHELINVEDGYYTIKNNGGDNLYVNVAGRKTVTFVGKNDAASMPGTVIRLKVENDTVKVLRSQGVDLPGYAERAMNYVPKIVQLVVEKLNATGEGSLLGANGLDALMKKFNESFDYHLYLEKPQDGAENYRIYGRTPSMKPVVDFYAENKENVDAKLPMLESFINSAIDKVLEKTHGSGASTLEHISLENIWAKMGGTEAGLTAPVDEASTLKFYEQVLSSEANVWNFAYQTAMIYWGNLKNHPRFAEVKDKLGEYAKYIDRVENIQPDFRYYIVQQNGKIDFISEGNVAITASDVASDADFTCWSWEKRTGFDVAFDVTQVHTI